jgi:tRNA(Ile)-lysidine synthase TilS/MesJ
MMRMLLFANSGIVEIAGTLQKCVLRWQKMKQCLRCILHTEIPSVKIDENGICNYCKLHDHWTFKYTVGGEKKLHRILNQIKEEGLGKNYDCIIGISGGCDSSYVLDYLVERGVRPLAVHWDNGWNTQTANENIRKITQGLGVDSYRVGVKQDEYNDILRSFLLASTPDADIPNDIALTTVLYRACDLFDSKYIINAHSFRTEGTTPLGWSYMDGGYILDVHGKFGLKPIPSYPNLNYVLFKYYIEKRFKRIRPLWYLNYDKQKAIKHLKNKFDWEWYGYHHFENEYTIFVGAYLWRKKFNMDLRYIEFSALIRSGFMTRENALKEIENEPKYKRILPYKVRRKLGLTLEQWNKILSAPPKTYRDYGSYRRQFKQDKAFFENALKKGLIPETFFKKYVEGVQ